MDTIVAEVFSKWYIYFYEQIGTEVYAPTPDKLFESVTQIIQFLYQHSPTIVRTYCTVLNTIPVQTEIIPVALAMLILYALFAVIVYTVRGIFRLVYGFVRLSIIISLLTAIICMVLHYTGYERLPLDHFLRSTTGTLSRQHPST